MCFSSFDGGGDPSFQMAGAVLLGQSGIGNVFGKQRHFFGLWGVGVRGGVGVGDEEEERRQKRGGGVSLG